MGSNPIGDANEIKGVTESVAPFCAAFPIDCNILKKGLFQMNQSRGRLKNPPLKQANTSFF